MVALLWHAWVGAQHLMDYAADGRRLTLQVVVICVLARLRRVDGAGAGGLRPAPRGRAADEAATRRFDALSSVPAPRVRMQLAEAGLSVAVLSKNS
jgi:hypothetical protein